MSKEADDQRSASLRPALTSSLDPEVFRAWFWSLDELRSFCRQDGLSVAGSRAEVTARIERSLRQHQRVGHPVRRG